MCGTTEENLPLRAAVFEFSQIARYNFAIDVVAIRLVARL
jgi:hypothetical protein